MEYFLNTGTHLISIRWEVKTGFITIVQSVVGKHIIDTKVTGIVCHVVDTRVGEVTQEVRFV